MNCRRASDAVLPLLLPEVFHARAELLHIAGHADECVAGRLKQREEQDDESGFHGGIYITNLCIFLKNCFEIAIFRDEPPEKRTDRDFLSPRPAGQGFAENRGDALAACRAEAGMMAGRGIPGEDVVKPRNDRFTDACGQRAESLGIDHVGATVFEEVAEELELGQ